MTSVLIPETTCPACGKAFNPKRARQVLCSKSCAANHARTASLSAYDGCHECAFHFGYCDVHQVPPVCVCDQPTPGWMNECGSCHRPYSPFFAAVRDAWRAHLGYQGAS